LRVVLRAVYRPSIVQCNNLISKHIASALKRGRDLDFPSVVVFGEVVGGKHMLAVRSRTDQPSFTNLGEAEGRSRSGDAVVVGTRRQVVEDGTLVGVGPRRPLDLNRCAGLHFSVAFAWLRVFESGNVNLR